MEKIKKYLKTNPIWIGIVLLFILLAALFAYMRWPGRYQPGAKIVTEELARETTVEKIQNPSDMVRYIMSAVGKKDLDMFLRGCPIDEICLGFSGESKIEQDGVFGADSMIAPSASYDIYFPIASAEKTGQFVEMFRNLSEEYERLGCPSVKEIVFLMPKEQMEDVHQSQMMEDCDTWGAKMSCEMLVLCEGENGQLYETGITLVSYYDYWKIMSVETSLAGEMIFQPCTENEFEKLKEDTEQKRYGKFLEQLAEDEWNEEKVSFGKENKEFQQKMDEGTAMLLENYFVLEPAYGTSPEGLIRDFILAIEKKDWTAALSYGTMPDQEISHTTENKLLVQAEFAKKIKEFYYQIIWNDIPMEEESLSSLGMTGSKIMDKLNPEYAFYLDVDKIEKTEDSSVYRVYYGYEGEAYISKVSMTESENGWQIRDFGKVVHIDKK